MLEKFEQSGIPWPLPLLKQSLIMMGVEHKNNQARNFFNKESAPTIMANG